MANYSSVLGVASQVSDHRLTAAFVRLDGAGPTAEVLDSWRGTKGTDTGRQLAQLVEVLRNRLAASAVDAIALKRIESPVGRPPNTYDDRIRFEAAAMLAAVAADLPYHSFRTQSLKPVIDRKDPYNAAMAECSLSELSQTEAEALAAALAALRS